MTTSTTQPYDLDDLFRKKEEGLLLNDHASSFYRNVMKLTTPLTKFPKCAKIMESMRKLTRSDLVSIKLVKELEAT